MKAFLLLSVLFAAAQAWTYVSPSTKANFPFGIVHLQITRRNNLVSRCTGAVIANHTIITAAHCVDDYPAQIQVDMNRGGPYNKEMCSTGFWNSKRKQCIRRTIINYRANQYFRENGLDDYFYKKLPERIPYTSKHITQHPNYIISRRFFMQKPAKSWLRSDIAVLSVKKGFFKAEQQADMYKYTFKLNRHGHRPNNTNVWPRGKIRGSGYGYFKPVDHVKSMEEEARFKLELQTNFTNDIGAQERAIKLRSFNEVKLRTGHAMVINNDRLRREMKTETQYDVQTGVDREIMIDDLLGFNDKKTAVDFPSEYLPSVGIYTMNNQYKKDYQNKKPHELLPPVKPTMCYGDSGGPMWQWYHVRGKKTKKPKKKAKIVPEETKQNFQTSNYQLPKRLEDLGLIKVSKGQQTIIKDRTVRSAKLPKEKDPDKKKKPKNRRKQKGVNVPMLFGVMSLMDDDCQQFMISVKVAHYLDFIKKSARYKADRKFISENLRR